jgi:hypothetical protein
LHTNALEAIGDLSAGGGVRGESVGEAIEGRRGCATATNGGTVADAAVGSERGLSID